MELRLESITKTFKDKIAVDNLTITLNNGIYGLLGPNGSGKTTLMRVLADVLNETKGRIYVNGRDKKNMGEEYRDLIGYLPQDIGFYSNFTAEKFLYYVAALKGIEKRDAIEKIDELLALVNLEEDRKRKIGRFSGGMKQRLGIAQALLNDPKILILDEPTAGLDPNERIRFKNLIASLSRNRIVILSTHIVSDIEFLANDIIIMKDGKLLEKNTTSKLTEKIRGRVWTLEVDEDEIDILNKEYKVANTWLEEKCIKVRIVSDKKPGDLAVLQEPNLEDLFLYYFGKEDSKNDRIN
ncbi:ABC-type multidrug transport system, ATPase component [Anaerosporobacter mobilis DSM 15930]|jgi:ABC-type multidrug transport system ATPase subunit|uniref:ABC-type multidrug transport system, ATPase component n=1 Tax=Anaerosporobacter mobilis DSM 15930 TaxID=1120996 RepID=A0A1M7NFD4_9FIRM|nr:ABC transporter ATP-binding protein [Anaerosporobacter mobilis]SHN02396.1 ABC-type multidrug transport system, ATPase component [Anaerosporobacter mobilis DSM 15930]